MDDNNNWISQPNALENMVTNFYKTLFSDTRDSVDFVLSNVFPHLEYEELVEIGRPICDVEISHTVKQMKGLKAPGPDGLQAIFFQSQ
uniref:LINE-1 reverse transcriptase isogeny n=1 Tax=Cajanus cajan TaxID=3821 RepID=A0A151RY00_CAJCA|nr:LINE-1 reverse transcriptase isogeny [Cajanus cajan]KYP47411.1 LINE-1 reverse transcriptase isogeny [Cajanus cajan]